MGNKEKILENSEVKSRLLDLKVRNQPDKALTRNEHFELSLLSNIHLVKEWAARNNILGHGEVETRIKDLQFLVNACIILISI